MKRMMMALAASVLFAAPASAASVLLGSSNGTVATLDTDTGILSNVFDTGSQSWFDIALDSSGLGWGLDGGTSLWTIDLGTQSATQVGNTNSFINGLAFGPGDMLYGTGGNALYSLNQGTGAATQIGSSVGPGFNSSGDIAHAGGTTFYGTSSSSCGGSGDCLWSIDSGTGVGTQIGSTGVDSMFGLAMAGGTLFGTSANDMYYSINTTTGAATLAGSYSLDGQTFGAAVPPAPIPVPASLPLLLSGIFGFGILRRKRRAG